MHEADLARDLRRRRTRRLLGSLACTVVAACGGGGPGGGGPGGSSSALGINVHGPIELDAESITLRFAKPGLQIVSLVGAIPHETTSFEGALYLIEVPLQPGENDLELQGRFSTGEVVTEHLHVTNAALPRAAVVIDTALHSCLAGTDVPVHVGAGPWIGTPAELLVDREGDGVLDQRLPFQESFELGLSAEGWVRPTVTVVTQEGRLFTSSAASAPPVAVLASLDPQPLGTLAPQAGEILDLDWDPATSSVLALTGNEVLLVHLDGNSLQPIQLAGTSSPQGIHVGPGGDLYVADTGNSRILRWSAASGYRLDPTLGAAGSLGSAEQLAHPHDVIVVPDTENEQLCAVVADTGNARIRVFDLAGNVVATWRGDASGGKPVVMPKHLAAVYGRGVAVVDESDGSVRVFDTRGREHPVWRAAQESGGLVPSAARALWQETGSGAFVVSEPSMQRLLACDGLGLGLRQYTLEFAAGAVLRVRTDAGERLLVAAAGAGSPGVHVLEPRDEPSGCSPEELVSTVVAALSHGDLESVRSLIDPQFGAQLAQLLADPDLGPRFQELMQSLGTAQRVQDRPPYALVSSAREASDLRWLLRRSSAWGPWLLVSF